MRSLLGLHDRPETGPGPRSPAIVLATQALGARAWLRGASGRAARETWPAQLGAALGVFPVPQPLWEAGDREGLGRGKKCGDPEGRAQRRDCHPPAALPPPLAKGHTQKRWDLKEILS